MGNEIVHKFSEPIGNLGDLVHTLQLLLDSHGGQAEIRATVTIGGKIKGFCIQEAN